MTMCVVFIDLNAGVVSTFWFEGGSNFKNSIKVWYLTYILKKFSSLGRFMTTPPWMLANSDLWIYYDLKSEALTSTSSATWSSLKCQIFKNWLIFFPGTGSKLCNVMGNYKKKSGERRGILKCKYYCISIQKKVS